MRKFVCAAVVAVCTFSVAMAEEFTALITKIDGKEVTLKKIEGKGKDAKVGDATTLKLADKATFIKGGKFNKDDKKFEGGDPISSADEAAKYVSGTEKGRLARVTTDGGSITEIRFLGGKKGGKGKKKKDAN